MASGRFLSRLRIVSRALLQRLATRGRRSPPGDPRRILVAHHFLLGDTLMLTPLLAKLRVQHPRAEIVMTVALAYAPLYALRPYGVSVIGWNPRDPGTLNTIFSRGPFDIAYVPGDNRHSWLALAVGSRWITAFQGDTPGYKNWPVDSLIPFPASPTSWADAAAELVPGPAPPAYDANDWKAPSHRSYARPSPPYCVLHVGASTPLKQWEPQKWRRLAALMESPGLTLVWSAGKGEEGLIAACDPEGHFPSLAGQLDLPQMWNLLAGARFLVSPDTGIAHLGRIVGVPTITLFGPGSATICGAGNFWRSAPYRAITVDPFECRNQNIIFEREISWVRHCTRSVAECASPRCMRALDVARVAETVVELLAESKAAGSIP